jgi:hypothetical protein
VTVHYDPAAPERFSTAATSRVAGTVAWAFVLVGGLVLGIGVSTLVVTMSR